MHEISSSGVVTYFGGSGLNYGEIYVKDNTTAYSSTGGKAIVNAFANNGLSNGGITPESSANRIAVGVKGTYDVNASATVINNSAQAFVLSLELYTNGGTTGYDNVHADRELSAGSTVIGSISMNGFCAFSSSDTVEIWAQPDTTAVWSYTISDITLTIKQIGGSTA